MSREPSKDAVETLVKEFVASGARELHIRCDDFELYLSDDAQAAGLDGGAARIELRDGELRPGNGATPPVAHTSGESVAPSADEAALPEGAVIVRAPYMGTFYRAPKPGSPVYVEVGTTVTPDTELCLVEVMKLFTAVRSPIAGRVHAILAADGQMVEANQAIFAVRPA